MVMYTCSARHAAVNTGQVPVLASLSPSPPKQHWNLKLIHYPWSSSPHTCPPPLLVSTESLFYLSVHGNPGPVSLPHPPADPSGIPAPPIQNRVFQGRGPTQLPGMPRFGWWELGVFSPRKCLLLCSALVGVHLLDAQLPVIHEEPTDADQGADYSADIHGHFARCEDHMHCALGAVDSLPGAR